MVIWNELKNQINIQAMTDHNINNQPNHREGLMNAKTLHYSFLL